MMPSDKESYVCVADLKRKMRAYLRYRMSNDMVKRELLSIVERLPITVKAELETTLDDVSVVRCKDCLFSEERHYLGDTCLYCKQFCDFMEKSDFCCRAERKDGGQNDRKEM